MDRAIIVHHLTTRKRCVSYSTVLLLRSSLERSANQAAPAGCDRDRAFAVNGKPLLGRQIQD